MARGNRKIDLGVMGFADVLFQMGIPYNTNKALSRRGGHLAYSGGVKEGEHRICRRERISKNLKKSVFKDRAGCRYKYATTTTIALTGTVSIIAGFSSGIESLFPLSFRRNIMDNDELIEVNPYFEMIARKLYIGKYDLTSAH